MIAHQGKGIIMRPASIVMFERLFLASVTVSVLNFIVNYQAMTEQLEREPGMEQLGLGAGFMTGTMAVGVAIYLLLWYFIAHKASRVAKWILVVFTALGVASMFYSLATAGLVIDLTSVVALAYYALAVGAVVYLFKPDAESWLGGEKPADPEAFD